MSDVLPPAVTAPPILSEPTLSPWARAVAVFVRPSEAWAGLSERAQWWFPFAIMMVFNAAWTAVLFPRAIVPMTMEGMQNQVANGQIPPEQLEAAERMMTSPLGMSIGIGFQALTLAAIVFAAAGIVLLAVGFLLGVRFRYRLALEVVAWSWLVQIPMYLAAGALAWFRESLRGVHVGFGALLPEPETPTRLSLWLGNALDAIGPLALWPVVVAVLGASLLSGAPRRAVGWALGSLYLVLSLVMAAVGAMNAPLS